jgi:hypothetical protein
MLAHAIEVRNVVENEARIDVRNEVGNARQPGLYGGAGKREWRPASRPRPAARMCLGCRSKEARYGFRNDAEPQRTRTLCFDCFRMEIERRQAAAAQLARGWNAEQVALPLPDTLERLDRRRRRAQIAARHALGAQ